MVEFFLAAHGPHGSGFTHDDLAPHPVERRTIAKVAIAVKPAGAVVDPEREEDAGDAGGQELAHGEHVAAIKQWRQYLEHVVVVGL